MEKSVYTNCALCEAETVNEGLPGKYFCYFTRRQRKRNARKRKRGEDQTKRNTDTVKTEENNDSDAEPCCSYAVRQSFGRTINNATGSRVDPEEEPEGAPGNERTETDESEIRPVKKLIQHFRKAKLYGRYKVDNWFSKGCFGRVYKGVRTIDRKKVAVSAVVKRPLDTKDSYITLPGHRCKLPPEVALLGLVCKPPRCPYVIELLEWIEMEFLFILVLERPDPCINLYKYWISLDDGFTEEQVGVIMKQTVAAALHCRERGVFHRAIKKENILVNPSTLAVKLINFGSATMHKDTPYTEYGGTPLYIPPEWTANGAYMAEAGTVWGLGLLMYTLLIGLHLTALPVDYSDLIYPDYFSEDSCNLLMWCLRKNPEERPTLKQILAHNWFQEESRLNCSENVLDTFMKQELQQQTFPPLQAVDPQISGHTNKVTIIPIVEND